MFRRVVIRLAWLEALLEALLEAWLEALLEALWLMIREAWSEVNRSGTRQSPAA